MSHIKTGFVVLGFVAMSATNGYLFRKLDRQRKDLTQEITALRESTAGEMAGLRTTFSAATRQSEESWREQLVAARRQATLAAGKAKTDAVRRAEELAQRLAAEQQQQQQQVASELTGLKEAATTTNAKVAEVGGKVAEVGGDVKNVKSELDKTVADLKSVRGDLGVQSGLIATNAKELAALKALGERNYFEFSLARTKQPQAVGNIRLALQKVDPKRNRYTVTVMADDKRIEKRDKTTNEPVQFYVLGTRQPYEIVVNEVNKDRIVGYLAIPKAVELASR